MILTLHEEEKELDSEDEKVKSLKEKRIKKDRELAKKREMMMKGEEEYPQEKELIRAEDIGDDWKTKVSEGLMAEFHERCMRRLKTVGDLDWTLYADRFNSVKQGKNPITINKSPSPEWIKCYRLQE